MNFSDNRRRLWDGRKSQIGMGRVWSVGVEALLWAVGRVIWSRTEYEAKVVCTAFPHPLRHPRRIPTAVSKLRNALGVNSTPQAGQPNGNKKLPQTELLTPRRLVNIKPPTPFIVGRSHRRLKSKRPRGNVSLIVPKHTHTYTYTKRNETIQADLKAAVSFKVN